MLTHQLAFGLILALLGGIAVPGSWLLAWKCDMFGPLMFLACALSMGAVAFLGIMSAFILTGHLP